MARPRRSWTARAPWLVLALRLIVASLAVQTGGVARDASDVVWAFALGVDAPDVDDDCLRERGDCHCPPGCPNCHCSHGVASLPQGAAGSVLLVRFDAPSVVGPARDDTTPPSPVLSGVYRPPRSLVVGAS